MDTLARASNAHEHLEGSFADAAAAVVDALALDGLLPSVYVEQSGRLRCYAVRGYWQIFDGMPPDAGVIGHTFRTGEEVVIADVSADPNYLTAVDDVRAEACFPLRAGSRVLGALNVESLEPFDAEDLERLRGYASALSDHLTLHGLSRPTAAQRLARCAARLAELTAPEAIVEAAIDAACEVADLSSAMLVLSDEHAELHLAGATGPFAPVFAAFDAAELARVDGWVATGTSSYTIGDAGGLGFAGHESLRDAGARTLVVLPLEAQGRRIGFMALADRDDRSLHTEDVELLELLATQVAAGLRVAVAVEELRRLAVTDPLTGLGHHGAFHAQLAERLADPGRRCAVVLVDLDAFKAHNDTHGHAAGDAALRALADLLRSLLPADGDAFRVGGDEFALLLSVAGPAQARRAAEAVHTEARAIAGLTVSVGVAVAEPGELATTLLERADAALYDVKRAGRDGVGVAAAGSAVPAGHARLF